MAIVSDVEIRLRADIARLQQDLTAARRSVDTAMNGVSRSVDVAKKALAAIGVGFGIKEIVSQVIDAQREFDKLNASLVTATGSTANAAQAFGALQRFASTTPYSVSEATEAFIKLRNLGLNPGEKALTSYGNTAASMGKSLNQLIEAVADAATGEFERLKEFGIKAKQNGDLVNFTFQGTTKTIGNNAKEIQKYLIDIGNVNFAGAMEKRLNTLDGAISNLGDAWQSTLRAVSTGGFGEGLQASVLALSNALSDLGDIFKAVGGEATSEGSKVKEAAELHEALTFTFKGIAIVGVGLVGAFREIGSELGALGAIATAVAQGDFAGVKVILAARAADAKSIDDWLQKKIKAIQGSVDAGNKARDEEAANVKKNGGDQLTQFGLVLNAEQLRDKALADSLDIRNKLDGVDAQAAGNLKKLKAAYETGAISLADYNRYVAQANKETTLASTSYKNGQKSLDMQAESIKRATEAQTLLNQERQQEIEFLHKSGQISNQDSISKTADAQIADLNAQIVAQQQLEAIARKRIDNQKEVKSIDGEIANLRLKIDTAQKKRDQDLLLDEQERYKLSVNNTADLIEAAQAETKAQQDRTRDSQDEIEALGLTSKQVAELTAARLRDQAAALEMRAQISIIDEVSDAYRRQADELRKQADLVVWKEQIQSYQKFWGDIEQTAHDTFVSIADGGKDTWTRLKDSAKNIFFEWLYQMTLKKWIINIGTSTSGTSAIAGLAGGPSGSGSSALDLISMGKKIYDGFSSGSAGFGSSIMGSISTGIGSLGTTLGSNALQSFAHGFAGFSSTGAGAEAIGVNSTWASAGSSVGAVAGPLAGIAGGIYGGRMISGGYGSNGAVNTGTAIGAAVGSIIPVIGTAFGALIGGLLGGAYNRAFGYKAKEYSDTSTLNGMLGSQGFSGTLDTSWTQKGGWFRSDKHGTDYTKVDDATVKALTTTYDAIKAANSSYAKALGISADAITNRTDAITLALGKDDAANQKAITDYFAGISDAIATSVLPNIGQFQQSGETASATLQRISTDFVALDAILSAMGTDSSNAFKAVGVASIEARERLVSLAGGLDALVSQTQYFNDNFLTDAEKVAPAQKEVNDQLAKFGLAGLTTVDQFKTVVQSLVSSGALATQAGAEQYTALLAIAPKYKQVADYLKDAANSANEAEETLVDSLRSAAGNALSGLQRAVDAQKKSLQTSFDSLMAGLQASIDSTSSKISDLQSLSDSLKNTSLPGTTMDRATAQAQIAGALAIARAGGVLPKADDIRDALTALQGDTTDQFSSLQDYQRDQLLTANNIQSLSGLTDNQLSVAEKTLQVLNDQKTAAQKNYDAQVDQLDVILERTQQQIDAINGVDNSVLTVAAAFGNFASAIQAALGNKTIASQPTVTAQTQVEALYQSLLGRVSDAAGLSFFANNLQNGNTSLAGVAEAIKNSAEYQAMHPSVVAAPVQYGTMTSNSSDQQSMNARMQVSMDRTASAVEQLAGQFNQVSGGGNSLVTVAA